MILRATNISKHFGNFPALKDVSFNLERGQTLAILGASGSGKTTLLRCLAGLEQLSGGKIEYDFDGEKVIVAPETPSPVSLLAGKVGFIFQDLQLWPHMTVLGNIIEAPIRVGGQSKAEAVAWARNISERLGIEEQLSKNPHELSLGQRQRAAIARTLATDPALILMDEITSALDPEMVLEIAAMIKALSSSGITFIVVSHQAFFARKIAEEMIFLHEGKGLYHGTFRAIQDDNSLPIQLKRFIGASEHF